MKKLIAIAVLAGGALVVPAQAKPPHPSHPSHASHPSRCAPHAIGWNARGTLIGDSLTQTQGAATAGDDRYSGTLSVDIRRANHRAPTGSQAFTLIDARLRFHVPDRNSDGRRNLVDVRPGDRVALHGRITVLRHGCGAIGFTPTVTVRKVDFDKPKRG
jgi:hypothetical protein